MNTGIQDAFNLGWKLAAVQKGAEAALLDSYEAERLPVAQHVLGLSTRLAATSLSANTKGLIAQSEDTSQLGIHYRESPLSHELRSTPGSLRAGDRAPDAPGLLDGDDGSSRLFDCFRGPQAMLLAFGEGWEAVIDAGLAVARAGAVQAVSILQPGAPLPASCNARVLTDSLGHAEAAYEPGDGTLFAVRPDGVVGFASDQRNPAALMRWLRQAGLAE